MPTCSSGKAATPPSQANLNKAEVFLIIIIIIILLYIIIMTVILII